MKIGLPEVRSNSFVFAARWKGVTEERAEAQSFWNDLFAVYGMSRQAVASFEEPIKNLKGGTDRIDVFWKGVMMGEHKSAGRDLSKAASQAMNYIQSLVRERRGHEVPKYLVVSDFVRILVYDLGENSSDLPIADFKTVDLPKHFKSLLFLGGNELAEVAGPEKEVDLEAVELLGVLHDELERGGFTGTGLERLLVRILFCLFAEDTGIFDDRVFSEMIRTARPDGSDLGPLLTRFFKVLDQPREARSKALPSQLADLPYVNGALFRDDFGFAEFDAKMLVALQHCATLDWSRISPAVFGSLFQSVMLSTDGKKKRRQIGAHYTSERDILRVIGPLFLDELKSELERAGTSKRMLNALHDRLAEIRLLDPACGCGNFLVVAYRELRLIECEVLRRLLRGDIQRDNLRVRIDQVNGIEINEWPARIAEVAMFLIEHQMDDRMRALLPKLFSRLPIKSVANIHVGNALTMDWNEVIPASECTYVLGNPPFVGAMMMTPEQRQDLLLTAGEAEGVGVLDYVAGWYFKARDYIPGTRVRCAFVSTNSICQGEQVGLLWEPMFRRGIKIDFGYRTFAWISEARGKAAVHVVIVGFSNGCCETKTVFEVDAETDHVSGFPARNIAPYLFDGPDTSLRNRGKPICSVPPMAWGSQPRDGGNLLLSEEERVELLQRCPDAVAWVRPYLGADEFINGFPRFCLWLPGIAPAELRRLPEVARRVEAVRKMRLASKASSTQRLAEEPTRFAQIAHTGDPYLLVPGVSSERRPYIPIGFIDKDTIASNLVQIVPNATLYEFGFLSSTMHMAWVRQFCGRLKSDFRYSKDIVYNNYPWPQDVDSKAKGTVERTAQAVLDARRAHPGSTLADLYDPIAMPADLRAAHDDLDKAVDRCYRKQPFTSERERVEFLFDLYQKLAAPLAAEAKPKKRTRKSKSPDSATVTE
ncbi:MAG: class I SAM-dependent DNA methyltransferase [Planctomycetota bacterium]|nr:class I SAM-dependent DNA methyltransferase [Planctomycetota bacterium]